MEISKPKCSCNKATCSCTSTSCSCGVEACSCCLEEKMVTITADDLKDNIEHSAQFTVVNVLEPNFFEDCHVKGSINVPLSQLKKIAKDWDKNRSIVVYCAHSSCVASRKAYVVLRELSFKRIAAFEGGMREWKQKGMKCEGQCTMNYLK